MFDFSFWEIIVVVVVALLVVGPERLPALARSIGTWVARIRRFVANAKAEMESEFNTADLRNLLSVQEEEIKRLKLMMDETRQDVQNSTQYLVRAVDEAKAEAGAAPRVSADTPPVPTGQASASAPASPATETRQAAPSTLPAPGGAEDELERLSRELGQTLQRPFAEPVPASPSSTGTDTHVPADRRA